MAKKHGFRGTPVKPSSRMGSVGGIFERRGDPMVSPRSGQPGFERDAKKWGRNLDSENPDFDQYFAGKVEPRDLVKPKQVDKTNAFHKLFAKDTYDPQRRAAQINLKMRAAMRKAQQGEQKFREENKPDLSGTLPDNIPRTNYEARLVATRLGYSEKEAVLYPSREKQTDKELAKKRGFIDFSGNNPPKEIKKNGKIYRRK